MGMRRPFRKPEPIPFDDPVSEQLAWLLDSSIGIGPITIGLDGLVGLIPGLGDVITDLMGMLIVVRAMKNGVHRAAILRMVGNLAIDALVGSVPVFGDLFDFAYKANMKNIQIYRESLSGAREPLKDWGFVVLVVVILLVLTILPLLSLFLVLQWIGGSHFFSAAIAFVSSA